MILALDLATRVGWCWGAGDRLPVLGHHDLPKTGDDVGAYLIAFEAWFLSMLATRNPVFVVFEAPVLSRVATTLVTRKLHALPGIVEMACHKSRRNIPVGEVSPASAKKVLTGYGRADKDEMVEAARRFGLDPKTHDEADAFAVWLALLRRRFPQTAVRWSWPIGGPAPGAPP